MSNYMSNGDAVQVFGTYANSIKAATPTEITYAQYQQLSPEQIANGNYMVSDWAGSLTAVAHVYHGKVVGGSGGGDVSGKADKVSGATNGNFAGLDSNGNLTDSGKKASDFMADGTVGVAKGGTGQTTLTSNAVITGNGTSAVNQVATASGALYATAANSAASFGTLPVAQGGTGATTFTSGAALIGSGTNAVTTRSITNNTSKSTALSGSTNLATMNSLLYGMQNYNNRTSAVNSADTNYTTAMARAIYATTTDLTAGSTALTNGTIALVYE